MDRIFPLIRTGAGHALVLASLFLSGIVLAGDDDVTVDVQGGQDNTLYETDAGNLSNGMGQHLFVGRTGDDGNNRARRALIKFDLSGIPDGATVQNADFAITVNREPMNGGAPPTNFTLHRVTQDWGEGASDAPGSEGIGTIAQPGDATWLHTFFDTDLWNTDGGDFIATASASLVVDGPGVYTFLSTPDMETDVQGWLDDPSSNFGWILIGAEQGSFNARRISSSQNPTQADWPALTLTYTPQVGPPPPPPVIPTLGWRGLVILLVSLLVFGSMALRRRA